MFPISAENSLNKKKSENVFRNALGIVLFGIICALMVFYFYPELIIRVFSGKYIPEAVSILFFVGIAFSFISLSNLVLLHKLSRGKTKGYWFMLIFIFIEIILLSLFSDNLFEFSIAFITSSAALLWGSIILMND